MSGKEMIWFVAGFLARAMIAYVSDLTWRWRVAQTVKNVRIIPVDLEEESIMRWTVNLRGIEWDDGSGGYDVSDLPREWTTTVVADNELDAVEYALTDAADNCGALIDGYTNAEVQRVPVARAKRQ